MHGRVMPDLYEYTIYSSCYNTNKGILYYKTYDNHQITAVDLIDKTTEEINLLQTYLPKQLEESEIMEIIEEVFNKVNPTSSKEMGLIMKEITPLVKGKADMSLVSKLIKDKLSSL